MKTERWYGHAPGMAYAITIYATDKADAKRQLREFLHVSRLPAGAAVWR